MTRRSIRWLSAASLAWVLAGCSGSPEETPLVVIGSIIGYAIFFGAVALVLGRAIFGPPD